MTLQELLAEAARRGVELSAIEGTLHYRGPKGALADLTPELAAHKVDLLNELRADHFRATADNALILLNRLRCYTLPAGRMPAVRLLAERLGTAITKWKDETVSEVPDDPSVILRELQGFERELIALDGAPDAELLEAVEKTEGAFPGSRLIELRRNVLPLRAFRIIR